MCITICYRACGGLARHLIGRELAVYTASFPSGHSMMSAVVYLTLAVMLSRTQSKLAVRFYLLSLAVALTFGVGVSRVYLGVHWPTDVLAGWCLGALWALAGWIALRAMGGGLTRTR